MHDLNAYFLTLFLIQELEWLLEINKDLDHLFDLMLLP